jgi:hypothetical protein
MKLLLPAIAAAVALSSCIREGPNMPLRPMPPLPQTSSREVETKAFYRGYETGKRDHRQSMPLNFTVYPEYQDDSTRDAFVQGYKTGYKLLPRPAR